MWCSTDLKLFYWADQKESKNLGGTLPSESLDRILEGADSPVFGHAKWCFSVVFKSRYAISPPSHIYTIAHPLFLRGSSLLVFVLIFNFFFAISTKNIVNSISKP